MRFIWGHALVNVFITGQRILGWSIYFSCACQRGPSRGWSVRRILLPYVYTCLLEYMTYNDWVVYTYKVYSNTLDICLVWIRICIWYGHSFEGSVPILRVLSSLNVSDVFRGGFKLVRPFFLIFPAQAGLSVPSNLIRGLQSCPQVFDHLTTRLEALLWDLAFYLSYVWRQGLRKFWKDYFAPSQEICSLPSFFLVSWRRRSRRAASLISDRIFGLAVFPHVLWGRRG